MDSEGSAYIVGSTSSLNFPIAAPLQAANKGGGPMGSDAFVTKLSADGGTLIYSTYLGGSEDDLGMGIALDAAGNAYVTGGGRSADFPVAGAFQQESGGASDAFLAKINAAGSVLLYSSLLGGESDDYGMGVALDAESNAYVTGLTGSEDFPTVEAAQPDFGQPDGLGADAFVTKVNAAGSEIVYSTFLGGSDLDAGAAIAVDAEGNAYITGETSSADFPTMNAIQPAPGGLLDGFVAKLTADGSSFEFCTYLGGSGLDTGSGIALDDQGGVYVTAGGSSFDQPVTFGAFQTSSTGATEALVTKIVEGDPPPKITTVSAASFSGEFGAAPASIASGFGEGLATGIVVATELPLPTSLAGTVVRITDSEGTQYLAQLFFVAPGQINYLIPEDAAPGLALVIVEIDGQEVARGTLRINDVAPSLFAANANGQGVAAAVALRVAADDTQTSQLIFDGTAPEGSRAALPIDLGPEGDRIFLLMFGTGMRGFATAATATVGGEQVGVDGPVVQPQFLGLDQANLGPLPRSLIGRGEVDIILTVDGKTANAVTVNIQ